MNKLIQLEQESKLLKKSQKEIEKEIENATQRYGENSRQVKRLNDDLNDNDPSKKIQITFQFQKNILLLENLLLFLHKL